MSLIRSKGSKVEMRIRRLAHRLGYRFRLHGSGLPGRPDLVFRSRKKVIFVHGCFWHRHEACKLARMPKSKLDFWAPKLEQNRVRDAANLQALKQLGWDVMVIWECEVNDEAALVTRLEQHLGDRRRGRPNKC